jgi:hypothetical protein
LRNKIGEKTGVLRETITSDRIAAFRRAVGASQGRPDVAPPTFMTVLRSGEFELFQRFGIPLSSVLHAEQTYTYAEPIRAGDEVEFETCLSQALSKRGGKGEMHFLTFDTEVVALRAGSKVPVGACKSVIVYREQAGRGGLR